MNQEVGGSGQVKAGVGPVLAKVRLRQNPVLGEEERVRDHTDELPRSMYSAVSKYVCTETKYRI